MAKGKAPTGKSSPPESGSNTNNLSKPSTGEKIPMNFKIDAEFVQDFKVYAVMHNMKLVDLFKACFETHKRHN